MSTKTTEVSKPFQLTEDDVARLPQAAELHRFQRKLETKMATMLDVPERRRHVRFPFKSEQLIAVYDGENVPSRKDFQPVRCHDISEGGFSFYAASAPDFKTIVVGLRMEEEVCWIKAKVIHDMLGIYEGERRILVGCAFLEKLNAELFT